MNKLKAFTITEMMVVALLTVITVGLAFSAWRIMLHQYQQYGDETEQALQLGQLRMLLERDFTQANMVSKDGDSSLVFDYNLHKVEYHFESDTVSRQLIGSNRIDVFPFAITDYKAFFQRLLIESGTTDFIRLKTRLLEKPVFLVFSKQYSSEELMNFNHGSQIK